MVSESCCLGITHPGIFCAQHIHFTFLPYKSAPFAYQSQSCLHSHNLRTAGFLLHESLEDLLSLSHENATRNPFVTAAMHLFPHMLNVLGCSSRDHDRCALTACCLLRFALPWWPRVAWRCPSLSTALNTERCNLLASIACRCVLVHKLEVCRN
jgi:hypothetical protein